MTPRKPQKNRAKITKPAEAAPVSSPGWHPAKTREPVTQHERTIVLLLMMIGVGFRFAYPTRLSIEHWDEAVYASNRFSDEGSYPARYLYAPPLLPAVIEVTMLVGGSDAFAAIVPNLLFGTLTVLLCWWAARDWFGRSAGLAAAALAALNDDHITFCRTALTDPALCFWFVAAVYFGWRALGRNRHGEAIVAGIAAGAAWATKYNGWLTLAVIVSGFIAWAVFERFWAKEWVGRLPVLGTIIAVTALTWSPVWFSLPPGGYAEIAQNQAGYFVGLKGWTDSFLHQATNLRYFESWASAASLGLALLIPVLFRRRYWLAIVAGVFGLAAIPVGVSAFLLLPALIGPVLYLVSSYVRRQSDDAARFSRLAAWLVAAWVLGLFVSTPTYTAYPRLVLPWLVSAWLGTSAIFGWAIDSWTNGPEPNGRRGKWAAWIVVGTWLVAGLATLQFTIDNGPPPVAIGDPLVPADGATNRPTAIAAKLAASPPTATSPPSKSGRSTPQKVATASPPGAGAVGPVAPHTPVPRIVRRPAGLTVGRLRIAPRVHSDLPVPGWLDRTRRARTILDATEDARRALSATATHASLQFLTYGEPAIFFQLRSHGYAAAPVFNFDFLGPGKPPLPEHTLLLAYSTPEFEQLIKPYSSRLRAIAILGDSPSDLVLLDRYSPADLAAYPGRPLEHLGLYQVISK